MSYATEIDFLTRIFSKAHINFHIVNPSNSDNHDLDFGFRELIGLPNLYQEDLYSMFQSADIRTIYRIIDRFNMHYFYFWIPGQNTAERMAVVGPYFDTDFTHEELLENCEKYNLSSCFVSRVERILGTIPLITDSSHIYNAIEAFYDIVWGQGSYKTVDSTLTYDSIDTLILNNDVNISSETLESEFKTLEKRYQYENTLMKAVELGNIHKALEIIKNINSVTLERRTTDPLRNMKNYCVISNTLLRKAAEQGGLHPYYLDKISSAIARKIESSCSTEVLTNLFTEMFLEYCKMVHTHSTKNYSKVVQDTILYINTNLTADLSLSSLAEIGHINPSYLSSIFKNEVGQTITEYTTQRRIQQAKHLLTSTRLQIQTVAQHCGIPDVNYFSKVFKKVTGMTPKEFRNK